MAAGNQQKHLEFTFSIKALPFQSRASIRAHKHTIYYLKWLNCWKSRGETFYIPTLLSRTVKIRKFKLLYFRDETCFGAENLYKELFSIYLKPSVNKKSQNLAFFTLQSGDVTVKTIYIMFLKLFRNSQAENKCNKYARNKLNVYNI